MNIKSIRTKYAGSLHTLAFGAIVAMFLATFTSAAEPVGAKIFSIDAKTGTVAGKEIATGRLFEFQVKDAALLRSLKVGQEFRADLASMTALLPASRPGATAVPVRILKAEPVGAQAASVASVSSAASSPTDVVRVTFTCPTEARIKTFVPEHVMNGPYTEDPGDGGSVELRYSHTLAGFPAFGYFREARTQGQFIYCVYRQGELNWQYDYEINRTVIGCTTATRQINCTVKP